MYRSRYVEAEFYAVVRCVGELLGLEGLLRDLGMPMNIQCFTDSSAARGVAMRRRVGKIKHLETIGKLSGSTRSAGSPIQPTL